LLDLSTKIDPVVKHILIEVLDSSNQLGLEFFVIGATARDIIITNLYNSTPTRATQDIDFDVMISDWNQFRALRDNLLTKKDFQSTESIHRLKYNGMKVDIVPFGSIEKNNKIEWPPDSNPVMNVIGFDVAYSNSFPVLIDENKTTKFVTLPCLALLKLFAWKDRKSWTNKDADDFIFLLCNYPEFSNSDRMFNEHDDMLTTNDFDFDMAGSRLLGRDIAEIINPNVSRALLEIINNETGDQERYLLVEQMSTVSRKNKNDFDWHLKMLEHFKFGLLD